MDIDVHKAPSSSVWVSMYSVTALSPSCSLHVLHWCRLGVRLKGGQSHRDAKHHGSLQSLAAWHFVYLVTMAEVCKICLKVLQALKLAGIQKMQQHPQLRKIVLQRGPSEQRALPGLEVVQLLEELALLVLEPVAFIHNQCLILQTAQSASLKAHHLIGCEQYMKLDSGLQQQSA